MIIRNFFKRPRLQEIETAGEGVATGGAAPSPAPAVADTSAAPSPAPAPANMAEAMWGTPDAAPAVAAPVEPPAVPGQPRDEMGRFTFKDAQGQAVDKDGVPAPDQAAALAAQAAAAAPAPAEDLTKMPEGLGEKAQQRFQALANSNKDLTAKLERFETEIMPGVQLMQQTWTENQVQPEQFDQAMAVVGMINRGDYAGAQQALMAQLQHLAVLTGTSAQVDPLASFPDLQEQVQRLMMTPEAAAEVARSRAVTGMQQQAQQRQTQQEEQRRQQEQAQQAEQQAVQTAQADVNTFCQQMQKTDLDYSAIEARLLPGIATLVKGVPPELWADKVKHQYQLIKETVGSVRRAPAPAMQTLRPGGGSGGAPLPKTMGEAMWGAGFQG